MTRFAPPWALSAAAIDARGNPHLQPGVHLRVLPGLSLGLPVAPLLVERLEIGDLDHIPVDDSVVWTDAAGNNVTPPFDLGPASPATAWVQGGPGNPVIYAEVLVEPEPVWRDFDRWRRRGPASRQVEEPVIGRFPFPGPVARLPRSGVRVDALLSGTMGPSIVATATEPRYQVCATGMDRVQVTGAGRVTGIRVLRARNTKARPGREPWRLLALPVEKGARYQGLQNAWSRAKDRVYRGAPQLHGMHDEPFAPDPASCSPASDAEEFDRVEILWSKRVEEMVDPLLNDLSASPGELFVDPGPLQGTSLTTATMALPALSGVLQGALDPGMGRLLGLVERDESPPGPDGSLVVYVVRGAWTRHREKDPFLSSLLSLGGPDDPSDFPLDLPDLVKDQKEGPFLDLWTLAAVVLGKALPAVPAPGVGTGTDLGWVPEAPPPSSRRHVVLPLSGLVPAAMTAVARETPGIVGVNPRLPDIFGGGPDRAVGIVPAILEEVGPAQAAQAPGEGEVHDRFAPEDPTDYRVAQADWFGRWSPWSPGHVGAGVRPPVPAPLLEVSYVDPATPGTDGRLEVRWVQPRPEDLAAGGLPLDHLELTAAVGAGGPVVDTVAAVATTPGSPPPRLTHTVTVPALAAGEKRRLVVTGRWVDVGANPSDVSPPAVAQAVDPRAPAPLTLPNTLQYTSRPDALGRCRVDLAWSVTAGTAYRVYASDETTLRQRLSAMVASGHPGASAAASALAAATTAPDRAAVFRSSAALFDRTCFELLTASPLLATASGPMTYTHEVSGSLDVLVFYKVLPVTVLATSPQLELGGETSFDASTLLVRGIPNSAPPPTPTLTVTADPADPLAARLSVSVPAGQTAPVTLRVRRSRVSGGDAQTMPVVRTTTPGAWPVTVVDRGETPWDATLRFAAWSTYTWRVEVQGGPEPGSSVPGLWSRASAPASWTVMPSAPVGVDAGAVTVGTTGAMVTFTSDDPLDGGPEGSYVLDVYRRTPDSAVVPSGAVGSFTAASCRQPDGSYAVQDTTTGIPVGTEYLVEVRDPIGRRSLRVLVATVA